MRKAFATLVLVAYAIALAVPADAQTLPTPQSWAKNRMPDKPPGAVRICIFNAALRSHNFNFPATLDDQSIIGATHSQWMSSANGANPTKLLFARAYLKGPGEGNYWVELAYNDYYCRSFKAGAPVSIYVQKTVPGRAGGWYKLCIYGVQPFRHDVSLTLGAQNSIYNLDTCAFPPDTEVTHWD